MFDACHFTPNTPGLRAFKCGTVRIRRISATKTNKLQNTAWLLQSNVCVSQSTLNCAEPHLTDVNCTVMPFLITMIFDMLTALAFCFYVLYEYCAKV